MITSEELDSALRDIVSRERDLTLDSYVETIPSIWLGEGRRIINATVDTIANHPLEPETWIVTLTGLLMLGIEIGLKIAAKRAEIAPKQPK